MGKKAVSITIIIALLVVPAVQFTSFSSANFFPYPGPDLPRIYIRSDGSVEPLTAPIERTGNTYKLTDNVVLYTIEIQHDNLVLDGAGHTIQGNASWVGYDAGNNGVIMTGRKNVNVTDLIFEGCYASVRIISSSGISVIGNSFSSSNSKGVVIQGSTLCLVAENTFTALRTDLNAPAVYVNGTSNIVRNNTLTGSTYGIQVTGSSNHILNNKIESVLPLILDRAQSNSIAENKISGLSTQDWKGNEGIALFINCSNNLITGNTITGFINQAIRFVFNAENNTVFGNYLEDNGFAVVIQERAVNNRFYGNTFAADSCNVSINEVQSTFWDNGTVGNYWGNYQGVDSNGDGIGDAPYTLDGYMWDLKAEGFVSAPAGQDKYPLMAPFNLENEVIVLPQNEPFTAILIAISIAIIIAVAGLLLYNRKRRCKVEQA
jgi:parallel beta-helix repeat protein